MWRFRDCMGWHVRRAHPCTNSWHYQGVWQGSSQRRVYAISHYALPRTSKLQPFPTSYGERTERFMSSNSPKSEHSDQTNCLLHQLSNEGYLYCAWGWSVAWLNFFLTRELSKTQVCCHMSSLLFQTSVISNHFLEINNKYNSSNTVQKEKNSQWIAGIDSHRNKICGFRFDKRTNELAVKIRHYTIARTTSTFRVCYEKQMQSLQRTGQKTVLNYFSCFHILVVEFVKKCTLNVNLWKVLIWQHNFETSKQRFIPCVSNSKCNVNQLYNSFQSDYSFLFAVLRNFFHSFSNHFVAVFFAIVVSITDYLQVVDCT